MSKSEGWWDDGIGVVGQIIFLGVISLITLHAIIFIHVRHCLKMSNAKQREYDPFYGEPKF